MVHANRLARDQNLVHIQKIGFFAFKFSRSPYFNNHLSETSQTYTIIPCRVSFHSTTSDPRVHAGVGGARGQNLVHIQKIGFLH